MLAGALSLVVLCAPAVGAQSDFVSARFVSGRMPVGPWLAVSGGEVFLEALVGADGRVDSIRTLRTTPGFTNAVIEAVREWRFTPATEAVEFSAGPSLAPPSPVAAPVFVAAMFAPPALNGPTLGQPPQDLVAASAETPTPTGASPAAYPPRALGDGTVLVEVTIDSTGALTDAQITLSSPPFDAAALSAARSWSFRTARRHGNSVTTRAYLLFAFREPVIGR
jgi:TonB family protein